MKNKDVREEVSSRDGPEGENNNKSLFKDAEKKHSDHRKKSIFGEPFEFRSNLKESKSSRLEFRK